MSIAPVSQAVAPLANQPQSVAGKPNVTAATSVKSTDHGNVFAKLIDATNQSQTQADESIRRLASGDSDGLHNVVMTVAKADLSFRLLLEIRNRLIDSYQEIMRMQV